MSRSPHSRATILWLINGMGLGNCTRCLAVLERLPQHRHIVATAANGLAFFAGRPEVERVVELEQLHYRRKASGGLDLSQTIKQWALVPGLWRANQARLQGLDPDLVMWDSFYFAWGRLGSAPVFAINHADRVCRGFWRWRPWSVLAHFLSTEVPDWLYHSLRADQVFSPGWEPTPPGGGRWKSVGLVCRKGLQASRDSRGVVVMVSGSGLTPDLRPESWPISCPIDVLGLDPPLRPLPPQVCYHGKVRDSLPWLQSARILVVQAGSSAISEALALGVPVVVVPLRGHAEQEVNARSVEALGLGRMARADQVGAILAEWLPSPPPLSPVPVDRDGAATIAAAIEARLEGT